jgi:hypothetical protein
MKSCELWLFVSLRQGLLLIVFFSGSSTRVSIWRLEPNAGSVSTPLVPLKTTTVTNVGMF